MNEVDAARTLVEHGVLGALVVLQFGIILWLINRLGEKVKNGAAAVAQINSRLTEVETQITKHTGE